MVEHKSVFAASTPEQIEEVLRARADSLSAEQEEQATEDMLSLLLFALGEEWYAVPIPSVSEIYNEYVITPVPCVPNHILGVINIRGEIVSVTDVAKQLGLPPVASDTDASVIVVENDAASTALLVDVIGDITDVPRASLEAPVTAIDKNQAAFVSGSVYVENRLVGLIDLEAVLAPIGVEG